MTQATNRYAGTAGLIGAGLALGIGELLAGLFDAVASPLGSIGGIVVENTPGAVERWAISLFGTADKAVLAVGIAVVALIIGWFTGIASRKRFWVAVGVFSLFGAAGAAAGFGEPNAGVIPVAAAGLVSVGAGLGALWWMLRVIEDAAAAASEDTAVGDAGRRRFLAAAGVGGALALGTGAIGRALIARVPPPPSEALPTTPSTVPTDVENLEIPGLSPIVTPNEEFYRIDTALVVPRVNPEDWTLRVHGRVDDEIVLTYDDLTSGDVFEQYVTLSCVSNEVGGSLVDNALWTGVRLDQILERAGADRDGTQVVGRSVDDWTCGFPIEAAFDRPAMIAFGMNGEPLPRIHGYPARLVVPGLYGYVSATKWVSEIEIVGWDEFDAYWIPRGWAKEAPIKTQSRIDVPRDRAEVAGPSFVAAGVAWAPERGVARVEVSLDGGSWQEARLNDPLSDRAWVQWRIDLEAGPGDHTLAVRATDGTGETQTAEESRPAPDGATGHHTIDLVVA